MKANSGRMFTMMVAAIYALAYVFRWIYLSYYLHIGVVLTDVNPDWNRLTLGAFTEAFVISSIVFGLFFVTSGEFSPMQRPVIIRTNYRLPRPEFVLAFFIIVTVTLVLRRMFGAVLGEAAQIPYGLGTPIYRSQADLIPGIFILMAEAAWYANARRSYYAWVIGLALFNLAIAVITTSKAGLIYFAVEFIMLMYMTGQNVFAKPLRLAFLAGAGLAVFIISAQLRSRALYGVDALIFVSLRQGHLWETVLEVIGMIANRLPGTEGLALYCGYSCHGLPTIAIPHLNGDAGRIFTQSVINVSQEFDYRSPGYTGGWIIIAGLWGGVLIGAAFLRVALVGFRVCDRNGWSAAAKIVVCVALFRFILEGTMAWQDIASPVIAAVIVEWISRTVVARRGEVLYLKDIMILEHDDAAETNALPLPR